MHDPKVSICVPSYNHARFLPMALESALAQTYDDFEVVVVDDGSTDDSLAVAQSYAARHPSKVRVFTHPGHRNRGISETVNLAFEKARWLGDASLRSALIRSLIDSRLMKRLLRFKKAVKRPERV